MSNGTAAAMLLSDLIAGKENPWAGLYDSTRTAPFASGQLYQEGLEEAMHFFTKLVSRYLPGLLHRALSRTQSFHLRFAFHLQNDKFWEWTRRDSNS